MKTNLDVNQLLFKIRAEGREYRIYANGKVEGFGNDVQICNYFPFLCNDFRKDVIDVIRKNPEILDEQ